MKTPARPPLRPAPSGLEIFSPRGLAARAVLLATLYSICELAGLRENATFLSGTQAAGAWSGTVWRGLLYLFAYYGFVLAAPILLLSAALLAGWERLASGRKSQTRA